eukprot:10363973-Ditylum_brightwellii.AAC.1
MNPPAAGGVPDHRILVYVPVDAPVAVADPVALSSAPLVDVDAIVRVVSLLVSTLVPALSVLVTAILA